MTTTFTVVIPTYNRSSLVGLAVESILRQDSDHVQIVVSDNHSTDATPDVLHAINDPRVQIVKPPEHVPLPQHWEWARQFAKNDMLVLLSDDDALVPGSLKRLGEVADEYPMTTIVGRLGEYFSDEFPSDQRNMMFLWGVKGGAKLYPAHGYLKQLFDFVPPFDTHPTGWFYPRAVIDLVAARCGSFFKTNGAEYHSIPAALAVDPKFVHLDEHTGVVGRMPESIGTKIVFTNPGPEALAEYVADMEQRVPLSPISVSCFGNLMSEGLWHAKESFPLELSQYPKNIPAYLKYVGREFERRTKMGAGFGFAEAQLKQLIEAHDVSWLPPSHPVSRGMQMVKTRVAPSRYPVWGDKVGFKDILTASDHAVDARPLLFNPKNRMYAYTTRTF